METQAFADADSTHSSVANERLEESRSGNGSRGANPKIVFFGHFGAGNLGNEATLQSILRNLRRLVPDAGFMCICTEPEIVESTYNIAAIPSRRSIIKPWPFSNWIARVVRKIIIGLPSEIYRWVKGFNMLRGSAALIIPGTGLLNDVATLFNWGPYDIFRWSLTAKLCGCKLFFVSVGAGPLYSRAGRFFVKASLYLADFRSYRDESTLRYLRGIGFQADNDAIYPDLVFSLPDTLPAKCPRGIGKRLIVGLGLMDDARNYSVERPASFTHQAYLNTLVEFAKWLLVQGHYIRLLIGSREDRPVVQEFKSKLDQSTRVQHEGHVIDERVESVEDLMSQIARTDLVIATRFHNVLFALLLNKPVIAISFHHKCASLMSQIGLSEYCQDINHLDADRLIERFRELEKNAMHLQLAIKNKTEASRVALNEQYDCILQECHLTAHEAMNPEPQT